MCRRDDEDKTAKPAERSCVWGSPVITVNWFNVRMDGKKDEKERRRGGWKVDTLPPNPLYSPSAVIRYVTTALYQQHELL